MQNKQESKELEKQLFPHKALKWEDFCGTPDDDSHFLATTY